MRNCKALITVFWLAFSISNVNAAANENCVEIFSSNNTKEIDLPTAYSRMTGEPQQNLQDDIINTMQRNHLQQGRIENILGTYRVVDDQKITADNTEFFCVSPYQNFSNDDRIFAFARELAIRLKQESVAVFIPDNSREIAEIALNFVSQQPGIDDTIRMLHERLPDSYSLAFSLHLAKEFGEFGTEKVSEVEWLGSKTRLEKIKKAFPGEKISYRYGKAFLVYKNGKTEEL